jgi:hypothetical protein
MLNAQCSIFKEEKMRMREWLRLVLLLLVAGCSKSTDDRMREYLEFYYPTTGEYTYDIVFNWGSYVVTTSHKPDEEVHPDSEPYKGYIVMRPSPKESSENQFPIYLITPEGSVWTHPVSDAIAKTKTREEVLTEEGGSVTSTSTATIISPLEPVVDHFLSNKGEWKEYGRLEKDGDGFKLKTIG